MSGLRQQRRRVHEPVGKEELKPIKERRQKAEWLTKHHDLRLNQAQPILFFNEDPQVLPSIRGMN